MKEPEPTSPVDQESSVDASTPAPAESPDDASIRELEGLLQRGREILAVCGWNGSSYDAFRPGGIWVLKFRSQTLASLEEIFGASNPVYRQMDGYIEDPRAVDRGYHVPEIVALLQSAYAERCRERLFNAAPALLAAVGDEVIEVAETLANAGEVIHAASRAGEILRRTVGRMGRRALDDKAFESLTNADAIVDRLLDRGVVSTSEHLKIGAYLQIARDLHGPKQPLIHEGELREMVRWVSELCRRYRYAAA